MIAINFITPNVSDEDLDLFFGPDSQEEKFVVIQKDWTMANILVAAGILPSLTQARKMKEDKPIPPGFTIITRGKKKNRKELCIFNGNASR
jgi:hypothetical protein